MRALVLALPLLLLACGDRQPATTEPAAETTPPQSVDTPDRAEPAPTATRPETETATIQIEGMEEPIDLRLVTVGEVPLPFSTYIPADWTDQMLGSGEGTAVRMTMGEPPYAGSVTIFVPSEPNQGGVDALAEAVAESRGGAEPVEPGEPWVRTAYGFGDPAVGGSVRVGEHDGTAFYVLTEYPIEMGDGFVPRAALVLDRLRWTDDGEGLSGSSGGGAEGESSEL